MKKKILIGILGAMTVLGLASCKDEGLTTNKTTNTGNPITTTTPAETTPVVSTPTVTTPVGSQTILTPTPTTTVVVPTLPITTTTKPTPTLVIPPKDPQNLIVSGSDSGKLGFKEGTIVDNGDLEELSVSGGYESATAVWKNIGAERYTAYYKTSTSAYTKVDDELIRFRDNNMMRLDILGLKAETEYEVKIVPVYDNVENEKQAATFTVETIAYDRSGYAHFNYTNGVGAYNDDGTLKDDAIVIYVTDETKDDVVSTNPVLSDYTFEIPGNDWNNKEARGIGWFLNNAQYTKASRDEAGNIIASKTSNTYSETGSQLGFIKLNENHPICIRFLGTVTSPEGLTAFNSVNEGGTKGDNGHMARMKDYKNITIEGVGNDAVIEGWGFHFMCSNSSIGGESFEARNLTFSQYPEDALGMEGVQNDDTKTITAPVRNCWVHHNTFLPGYCANPAESDKSEGDGSCDFKRGYGFTMSYNYYEYCHKTNLIGSSNSSLQYDISFHHNFWYQCGSRIPLARQANIHFYNNYVLGDVNDTKCKLSYVTSLRANCYVYSEYNYYDGCKCVFTSSGGNAKAYQNTYVSCVKAAEDTVEAKTRDEVVVNNCQYLDIDYRTFDTNPDLFYYDVKEGRSDCYLTDSETARLDCIMYAGSQYRTLSGNSSYSPSKIKANEVEPVESISFDANDSFELQFPTVKGSSVVSNVYFSNVTSVSSSQIKFKGQGITFKLSDFASVTIAMSASTDGYQEGYIVSSTGKLMLAGSGTVELAPGIYYVTSTMKNKDTALTSMSFKRIESELASQMRIDNFNQAVSKLPLEITYNQEIANILRACVGAYSDLRGDEVNAVNYELVSKAYETFSKLGIDYVEGLINAIGTVTSSSGKAIIAAQKAYEELMNFDSTIIISNLLVLEEAQKAFEEYAVEECINSIDAIGTVTLESKEAIVLARTCYDLLNDSLKPLITNYQVLEEAEKTLDELIEVEEVKVLISKIDYELFTSLEEAIEGYEALSVEQQAMIDIDLSNAYVEYVIQLINSIGTVKMSSASVISKAEEMYGKLNAEQQLLITNYQVLLDAKVTLEELKNATQVCVFTGNTPSNNFFTVGRTDGKACGYKTVSVSYGGTTYTNAVKMESKTSISFTLETAMTVIVVCDVANCLFKVDDTSNKNAAADENGVLTLHLEAGTHTILKGDSCNIVLLMATPE